MYALYTTKATQAHLLCVHVGSAKLVLVPWGNKCTIRIFFALLIAVGVRGTLILSKPHGFKVDMHPSFPLPLLKMLPQCAWVKPSTIPSVLISEILSAHLLSLAP